MIKLYYILENDLIRFFNSGFGGPSLQEHNGLRFSDSEERGSTGVRFTSKLHFVQTLFFCLTSFFSFVTDSTKAQSRDWVGFVWTWPSSSFFTKKS